MISLLLSENSFWEAIMLNPATLEFEVSCVTRTNKRNRTVPNQELRRWKETRWGGIAQDAVEGWFGARKAEDIWFVCCMYPCLGDYLGSRCLQNSTRGLGFGVWGLGFGVW